MHPIMFCLGSAGMGSPASPPKSVRPVQSTLISFEQVLINKLHSSLVIPSIVSKKQPIISGPSKSSTVIFSSKSTPPDHVTELQYGALLCGIEAKSSSTSASTCIEPIIQLGTKEKKHILDGYQAHFGSKYPDSIVTKKKGKTSDDILCPKRSRMRPSLDKWYRVEELYLYNVITTIIKECRASLSDQDLFNLRLVNKDFANIVPKTCRWLRMDFTPLQEPR